MFVSPKRQFFRKHVFANRGHAQANLHLDVEWQQLLEPELRGEILVGFFGRVQYALLLARFLFRKSISHSLVTAFCHRLATVDKSK